jgi:hypothetical protein
VPPNRQTPVVIESHSDRAVLSGCWTTVNVVFPLSISGQRARAARRLARRVAIIFGEPLGSQRLNTPDYLPRRRIGAL